MATRNQRAKEQSGISLDFVINTALNTNTIANEVATELSLSSVVEASADGSVGAVFQLGDTQLDGQPDVLLVQGLTAAGLPVASPTQTAGTLGLPFLQGFDGVDFVWGTVDPKDPTKIVRPPSVSFFTGAIPGLITHNRTEIAVSRCPFTNFVLVHMKLNGTTVKALLDSSSPISIIRQDAAELVGAIPKTIANDDDTARRNGDMLSVADAQGQRLDLVKTTNEIAMELHDETGTTVVDFESSAVFVGNVPVLQALQDVSMVLGLDVLAKRPAMLLKAKENKLWIE